jgi:tRNA G18 (ribose-2'-O)-methylase SpoU
MNPSTHANHLFANKAYDQLYQLNHRPVIIADNLRNADNLGALIRLADNMGAQKVWFLGDEKAVNAAKLRRAAASSYKNISWEFTSENNLSSMVPADYSCVALETSESATNIFKSEMPAKCVLIVGNEVHGIRPEILEQTHLQVYIPIPGPTKSMNVSHAAAVFLFEWLRRLL